MTAGFDHVTSTGLPFEVSPENPVLNVANNVPISSAEITRALRGCFLEGFVYMYAVSFRFISKQRKTSNAVGISSLIF